MCATVSHPRHTLVGRQLGWHDQYVAREVGRSDIVGGVEAVSDMDNPDHRVGGEILVDLTAAYDEESGVSGLTRNLLNASRRRLR